MSMTVGDLVDALADKPRDRLVIMAKDAEGNGYSPLSDVSETMYLPDSTWSGETYPTDEFLDAKLAVDMFGAAPDSEGWSEEDRAPADAIRVIELGPVN